MDSTVVKAVAVLETLAASAEPRGVSEIARDLKLSKSNAHRLLQTWASVDQGYWYARSTEFLGTPLMQTLRWLRAPGDTIFAIGEAALVLFVFSIRVRRSESKQPTGVVSPALGD